MHAAPLFLLCALVGSPAQDAPPTASDEGVVMTFHHPNGAKAREGHIAKGRRVGVWRGWLSLDS